MIPFYLITKILFQIKIKFKLNDTIRELWTCVLNEQDKDHFWYCLLNFGSHLYGWIFSFFTALTFVKAIPIWIMIYERWEPKKLYPGTEKITIGLAFCSIGDILLLINGFAQKRSSPTIFFALGALSFLIGHIFYVLSFLSSATDSANSSFNLSGVMSYKLLYMLIRLILVGFCFFSLSQVVAKIEPWSVMVYVVPVYGTILLMLVMAVLFYCFTSNHIDSLLFEATILAAIGSVSLLASDTL